MDYKAPLLERIGWSIIKVIGSSREVEYKQALKFFEECKSVLDVGCGTGGFLELLKKQGKDEVIGIDTNPECVEMCQKKQLDVRLGDCLDIPLEDNRFDGVYCSHVIHVFHPPQALQLIKELSRVVKPNGVIAIATVTMYNRFFYEFADVRPYPPHAMRLLFAKSTPEGHRAPTIWGFPNLTEEAIWLRRPALFDFNFTGTTTWDGISLVLNNIQRFLFLRKYWAFNAYIMKIRNTK